MALKGRHIANNAGSANSFLNAVPISKSAAGKEANALVEAEAVGGKKQAKLVKSILSVISSHVKDQEAYVKHLDSKVVDVTLGRIATLLDEFGDSLGKNELADAKDEIIKAIDSMSDDVALKTFLANSIKSLFDDVATRDDIVDLQVWIANNFSKKSSDDEKKSTEEVQPKEESSKSTEEKPKDESELSEILGNKEVESLQDEEEGDYKDSTNAKNFLTLQTHIENQFKMLNANLKKIAYVGVFSGLFGLIGKGFGKIFSGIAKLSKGLANVASKTFTIMKTFGKITLSGIAATLGVIASGVVKTLKGIGSLAKGVVSLGSKIGSAIAKPFKAIGGMITKPFKAIGGVFSAMNPFKRSEKKQEERKQKAKDKVMDVMAKIIEKIWHVIEPFVDKVAMFMGLVNKFVIVPIALLVLKVLFIVGAIVALAVGLVIAAIWIKNKFMEFWNYIVSGELWEDIKAKMLVAWEWMKDFGKWIWEKLIEFGIWILKAYIRALKFIWIDIPVWIGKKIAEFGIWIWDKLCEFGKWLYDTYIYPYIIEPFKKYIWEPVKKFWNEKVWPVIQPFVQSLTELKDNIVKAFGAWDTNKSIWENLKNIGGILKDVIVNWWDNSPFKVFYEQYIQPMVKSGIDLFERLRNLGGVIKDAIMSWWNGDSSLGETLSNIGGIVWDTIVDWWNGSIFKQYWEKLKIYLSDMIKPLKDWYDKSELKKGIDNIIDIVKKYIIAPLIGIKTYLTKAFVDLADKLWIPSIEMDWGKFEAGLNIAKMIRSLANVFSFKKVYPLKGLVSDEMRQTAAAAEDKSLTDVINDEMTKMQKTIDDAAAVKVEPGIKPPNEQQAQAVSAQQVQQAAQPIQRIEQMNASNDIELKKAGEEINKDIAEKEDRQRKFDNAQSDKNDALLKEVRDFRKEANKKLDDPSVAPVAIPVQQGTKDAIMEND